MTAHLRLIAAAAASGLLLAGGPAGAAITRPPATSANAAPHPRPTPQELYVGCYLLAHDTDVPLGPDGKMTAYSAANCGAQALTSMTAQEGPGPGPRFCLPDDPALRAEPATEMAKTYLDYYERKVARFPRGAAGSTAFVAAMIDKWPCQAKP